MLTIALSLVVLLSVAALVVAFVAFPHRGEPIPHAHWLSDVMTKAVDKIRP